MGLFDFLSGPRIDQGVSEFRETPGAVLLDVRTPREYREGHIPGSRNAPLQTLDREEAAGKDAPLFVYCPMGTMTQLICKAKSPKGDIVTEEP